MISLRFLLVLIALTSLSGCGLITAAMAPIDRAIDRTDNVYKDDAIAIDFVSEGETTREEVRSVLGQPVPVTLTDLSLDVYAAIRGEGGSWFVVPGQGASLNRVSYAVATFEYDEAGRLQALDFIKGCGGIVDYVTFSGTYDCNPVHTHEMIDLRAGLEIDEQTLYLLGLHEHTDLEEATKQFERPEAACTVYVYNVSADGKYPRRFLLSGPQHPHTILGWYGYAYIEVEPGAVDLEVNVLETWGNSAWFESPAKSGSWQKELNLSCVAGEIYFVEADYDRNFWGNRKAVSLSLVDEGTGRQVIESKRLLRR